MKMRFLMLLLALVLAFAPAAQAEEGDISELVEFDSVMMESVSGQIRSAADMTLTEDNRAALAAMLSLEFVHQQPDFHIDYTLPIYVCKQGDMAAVAFGGDEDYVLVIYQSDPLSTGYAYLYGNDAAVVRAALEATNEDVWEVAIDDYNRLLAALVEQLQ